MAAKREIADLKARVSCIAKQNSDFLDPISCPFLLATGSFSPCGFPYFLQAYSFLSALLHHFALPWLIIMPTAAAAAVTSLASGGGCPVIRDRLLLQETMLWQKMEDLRLREDAVQRREEAVRQREEKVQQRVSPHVLELPAPNLKPPTEETYFHPVCRDTVGPSNLVKMVALLGSRFF